MTHILWDWNGTLLDDTQAAIDTLNIMLAARGEKPIERGFYMDHFRFPVRPFYESIGMRIPDEEWDALAQEYHDIYQEQPKGLNAQTFEALEFAAASGARQSIVSALRQDLLEAITNELGVAKYMDNVIGSDNLDGASKLARAREFISGARNASSSVSSPTRFIVIGDSLHDKEVADAIGAECVLCAQGSHAAWRLREVAPTGDTLLEAVHLALGV